MQWLIAYDIRCPERRRRIARTLERRGFRRQKSVFEGEFSQTEIDRLLDELREFVDAETDIVTAWPMLDAPSIPIRHAGLAREVVRVPWKIL